MLELRLARPDEASQIRAIEDDAGSRFAAVGLDDADLPGLSDETIRRSLDEGLLFVAVDASDQPVAFALALGFPDSVHLEELDVVRVLQGQGLGSRLLERVCEEATARGAARVTLTTYRDIAFNAPYYRRRGFVELHVRDAPEWLRAIRQHERDAGVEVRPRIAMERRLD